MKTDQPICASCSISADVIEVTEEQPKLDVNRYMARQYIANKRGIPSDEVTEEQIDWHLNIKGLTGSK